MARTIIFQLIFAVGVQLNSHAQVCADNLIFNGEMNHPVGENVVAWGWSATETTDINDAVSPIQTTPGYEWIGTPIESPSGGTWQNLFDTVETVTTYPVVTPGVWYTLCFQYASQGITSTIWGYTYNQPVGVEVWVNGVHYFTTTEDTTQYTWESACFTFLAEGQSISILFKPTTHQYVALDGVCLSPGKPTALESPNKNEPLCYPNPVKSLLTIENAMTGTYSLTDLVGTIIPIIPKSDSDGRITFDFSKIPKNSYTMRCISADRTWMTKLLVD